MMAVKIRSEVNFHLVSSTFFNPGKKWKEQNPNLATPTLFAILFNNLPKKKTFFYI